jgi:WS/DGAT/MGAT family acyltransferase
MTLHRLSRFDAALLAAETPRTPLHDLALAILDPSTMSGGYSFEAIREDVERQLSDFQRLHKRVVEVPLGLAEPWMAGVLEIDIDRHIRRAAVPRPGGPRELARMIDEVNQRPLDRSRPLWHMTVIEGLRNGSVAVLLKIHTVPADGKRAVHVLEALCTKAGQRRDPRTAVPMRADRVPGEISRIAESLPSLLGQPLRLVRAGRDSLRVALRDGLEAAADEATSDDFVPYTVLNGKTSSRRSSAYASLRRANLETIARAFEVSEDDVLYGVISGALRQYLEDRGELPEQSLVAGIASFSAAGDDDDQRPPFRLRRLPLVSDSQDPAKRMRRLRGAAAAASGGDAERQKTVARWLDVPSPIVIDALTRLASRMDLATHLSPVCNLLISNMKVSSGRRYLGGARVERLYPLGPIFDGANLHIACLQAGASVDIGLTASREHVPEPFDLAAALSDALAELLAAAHRLEQESAPQLEDAMEADAIEREALEAREAEEEAAQETEETAPAQGTTRLRLAP